jgi:aryl-alcohol dehydrogenase-like predicted oxidoreductase
LSGAFDRARVQALPEDDWRRGSANFQEPRFSANLALVERLKAVAGRVGCSLPELAVAWTLHVPGVTAAIVGARRADQVDGWIGASDVALSPEDLSEIERAIEETGAGTDEAPAPPSR